MGFIVFFISHNEEYHGNPFPTQETNNTPYHSGSCLDLRVHSDMFFCGESIPNMTHKHTKKRGIIPLPILPFEVPERPYHKNTQ